MGVLTLKCPNCGGELVFDPSTQKYRCGYCLSAFAQEELEALQEKDAALHEEASLSQEETASPDVDAAEASAEQDPYGVLYRCPSCGAQIVTEATTAATFCYYCHNPVVLEGRVSGAFLPDQIVPFQISREEAIKAFREHLAKKRFVPRGFFSEEQIEKLTGVYYPYWVYDCKVSGSLYGKGRVVRKWTVGDTEYTETSNFNIARGGTLDFGGLTRNALQSGERQLVESVQPFRLEEAKPFSMGYLSGFQAEKRDLEKEGFLQELRSETEKYTETLLRDTITGYAMVNITDRQTQVQEEDWRYVFLPVWVLTYAGGAGRIYYYAMNGQTGTVFGELPVDPKRLLLFGVILFLAVTALGLVGGYFL